MMNLGDGIQLHDMMNELKFEYEVDYMLEIICMQNGVQID
jgi:hypothetical protein